MMPCSFVVDSADKEKFESAKKELHDLISKPQLVGIPLLLLGNKNDLSESVNLDQLITVMYVSFLAIAAFNIPMKTFPEFVFFMCEYFLRDLEEIKGRDVMAYSISAKNNVNIDKVLDWLIKHAGKTN